LIYAHHPFCAGKIHIAQGISYDVSCEFFFRRSHGVFQVEDYGVGLIEAGIDDQSRLVTGHIKPAAAGAVSFHAAKVLRDDWRDVFFFPLGKAFFNGSLDSGG
jgi:hypothetical protein